MVRKGTGSPPGLEVAPGPKGGPPAPHQPAPCRAADSPDVCPILPKQARPENGEYGPSTTGHSSACPLSTDPSSSPLSLGSRLLGSKEAPRAPGPMSPPEEGAERTKHSKRRAGGQWLGRAAIDWPRPPDGYLTRTLAPVFSPPSQEGNRKRPRSLRGSSHPSQGPSDSKVGPWPVGHLGLDAHTSATAPAAHSCPLLCVRTQA